ncbi:MAG: hypothetical protein ACLQBD_24145 [Syntrophobacteraceae bacterium]
MKESIKYNAELVIKQMKDLLGVTLSYDEESVEWLDNYIVGIRGDLSREVMGHLVSLLGSFFGECIRRRYGGEWRQTEGQWAIVFDDRNAIFPFAKMSKHFQGEDESILGMYRTIPLVFGEVLKGEFSSAGASVVIPETSTQEAHEIASLLAVLRSHEYLSRKYRRKGDAYYDIGSDRFSMEYHNLAAEEERRADAIRTKLEKTLGAAGSIRAADPKEMDRIRMQAGALPSPWSEEESDFDDACFCARYPRWTQLIPGLWDAYEKWKDDPRFLQEAPGFRPTNPSWEP